MGKKDIQKPDAPKRALAPFFLFKQDVYEEVKKQNPDAKITTLTQIIAEKWKNVDATKKANYEKLFAEGKKKYEKAKKEYEDKWGPIERKKKRKNKKN